LQKFAVGLGLSASLLSRASARGGARLSSPRASPSMTPRGVAAAAVAEPPKLYGPHAPVTIPKTSDGYACTPDNLRRSVGCPHRTPI
jgi:hypothetical protein